MSELTDMEEGGAGGGSASPKKGSKKKDQAPAEDTFGGDGGGEVNQARRDRVVLVRAVFGEFMITMLFMFTAFATAIDSNRGTNGIPNQTIGAVSAGFAAVGLIYTFADVSGAHFNPAVTFGTLVGGKTSWYKAIMYVVAQLTGSLAAMAGVMMAFPAQVNVNQLDGTSIMTPIVKLLVVQPAADATIANAFFMEVFLTFIFVFVIFATAFETIDTKKGTSVTLPGQGNLSDAENAEAKSQAASARNLTIFTTSGNTKAGFAPLAIGLTLGMLCFLGGSVSGGAFNPARVFGPDLVNGKWDVHWIYWFADFLGAGLAAMVQTTFFSQISREDGLPPGLAGACVSVFNKVFGRRHSASSE
jgi:aquaporin related protein